MTEEADEGKRTRATCPEGKVWKKKFQRGGKNQGKKVTMKNRWSRPRELKRGELQGWVSRREEKTTGGRGKI